MAQYDNNRCVKHFSIAKKTILQLTKKLIPLIEKKNTKYKTTILVGIKITYSYYKLSHGAKYFQCSELFTIDKSLMNMVLTNLCVILTKCLEIRFGAFKKMI